MVWHVVNVPCTLEKSTWLTRRRALLSPVPTLGGGSPTGRGPLYSCKIFRRRRLIFIYTRDTLTQKSVGVFVVIIRGVNRGGSGFPPWATPAARRRLQPLPPFPVLNFKAPIYDTDIYTTIS